MLVRHDSNIVDGRSFNLIGGKVEWSTKRKAFWTPQAGRRPENRLGAIRVHALGAQRQITRRVKNGNEYPHGEMAEWSKALPC